jgi:hypothetical protein
LWPLLAQSEQSIKYRRRLNANDRSDEYSLDHLSRLNEERIHLALYVGSSSRVDQPAVNTLMAASVRVETLSLLRALLM